MATKAELIAEAKTLGIQVDETVHPSTIASLIKKAKEAGIGVGGGPADTTHPIPPTGQAGDEPKPPAPGTVSENDEADTPPPPPEPRVHETPTVPFDINKLTSEQLKQLKAALDETPSMPSKGRTTVTVRRFNDQLVIGIKNASSKTVLDPVEQKAVTKITVPVLFYGAKDFEVVDYKEFMQSERVKCEVVGSREVKDSYSEGVVYSQELKKEVEQIVHTVVRFYTVKLPNGKQIELFEDSVNL